MEFDYVIIGAGSAGAVLAARLSEDPGTSVLLLEAGRDLRSAEMPQHIAIPNPMRAIDDDDFRWPRLLARRTTRQEPKLLWRGRAMGGSSTINGQIAIRGLPDDFDRWEQAGCRGWGWAAMLPYFCKLETDVDFGDAPYHGRHGPIPVYRAPAPPPMPSTASAGAASRPMTATSNRRADAQTCGSWGRRWSMR